MKSAAAGAVAAGYAGDITAAEAWSRLEQDRAALLLDVRSEAEWSFVGRPDLSKLGKEPICIAWQTYPGMVQNPEFVSRVNAIVPEPGTPIILMCRSGARSRAAATALSAQGYAHCFNLAGGFEGDLDAERHRGRVSGWKAEGLPWFQA